MNKRVVTRDLDVCPRCGSKLFVHHVGSNIYEVTSGGFLAKELNHEDNLVLKCSKCDFNTPVKYTYDGSITTKESERELDKLETPNSVGKVEE